MAKILNISMTRQNFRFDMEGASLGLQKYLVEWGIVLHTLFRGRRMAFNEKRRNKNAFTEEDGL